MTCSPTPTRRTPTSTSTRWDDYAAWHLGLTEGANDETKARYAFVYGDLRRVHRTGLIACVYRASEWRHKEVELAAHDLLQLLDTRPRMTPRPPRGEVSNRGRASRKAAEKAWEQELGSPSARRQAGPRPVAGPARGAQQVVDGIEYVEWSALATALEEEVRPLADPTARPRVLLGRRGRSRTDRDTG